jgi:hypothetical protein
VIVHSVLFKFKPGIGRQDVRVVAVTQAMAVLPAKIGTIREWRHGFNQTSDSAAWDYGLQAAFDSASDLYAYFEHPAHLPVLDAWHEIAELCFVDFTV